jgi:glucosamine--fructose-6-phosphate aminotransferase (isomerizing)
MCGIIGYTGSDSAQSRIIEGLRKLEYRGYDSAGIALVEEAKAPLLIAKRAGKLANLEEALTKESRASTGIGHTRWATHGGPTDVNAHPHTDETGKVAVIHNGIIENYLELKHELEDRGHKFKSETDTESVAFLLADELKKTGNLASAMRAICKRLKGSFTLLAIDSDNPKVIVGARRNSPLVVGVGKGENYLASDVSAFIAFTKSALELGQDQIVEVSPEKVVVTDLDGRIVTPHAYEITWDSKAAERGGFKHFMLKEIYEQPKAVADTLLGRIKGEKVELAELKYIKIDFERILILACGTAFHAGLIGKYALEEWTYTPVDVELASEFRYRKPVLSNKTLVITISQSGETMDTLMALRHAKSLGATTISICNTIGSTIPRESDAVLYTHAGPEIAVASTKALLTQIIAIYLIALYFGERKSVKLPHITPELLALPNKIEEILETVEPLREMTRGYKDATSVLFLGRHVGYPAALEGALKLKELAYMHAEGFAGGELKHGPIALIENGTPVIAIVPPASSEIAAKMISNIEEVRARGARVIAIADSSFDLEFAEIIRIPKSHELLQPILSIVPLQVFAYEMSVTKGNDVDQPRNLAKSVTVE